MLFSKLITIVKKDGRLHSLANAQPANLADISKHLQEAGGRRRRTFRHQCSAPLGQHGMVITPGKDKYKFLGDFFEARLDGPRFLRGLRSWDRARGKGRGGKTKRTKGQEKGKED